MTNMTTNLLNFCFWQKKCSQKASVDAQTTKNRWTSQHAIKTIEELFVDFMPKCCC